MKAARNKGFAWLAKVLLPRVALTLAASLAIASCAQEVKITAPRYALVYGIAAYQSNALQFTVNDARSMVSTLENGGWNAHFIPPREDSAATKAQIKSDLLSLITISSDSIVLVYYSGHGTFIDSSWGPSYYPTHSGPYIVPYDAVGPSGLDTTTVDKLISPTELEDWLSQVGTKNVIVIFDSCYSGGFVHSGSTIDASPPDYSLMPAYSAFSTAMSNFGNLLVANASASGSKTPIVISAAGLAELSWETNIYKIPPDTGHGVFTYYLLQAATNGDSDGDGFVTMTEAYAYTVSAMKSGWDSNPGNVAFLPHLSGGTRDLVLFTK